VTSKQQILLALWVAHPSLQLVVATLMFRRKLYRSFPYFFAYIVAQILVFSVLFPAYLLGVSDFYFFAYWGTTALSVALGFKVIHEIFLDIFRPYHTLKDLGSVLFKWAGLVMLLVAGVMSASSRVGVNDPDPLVQAILTLQRSVRVVQCGMVFFLLVFSKYLGISWKQRSFGIALGFGGFATVELSVIALCAGGYISQMGLNLCNMVAYNFAIVAWIAYSWIKSPSRESSVALLKSQRWEQSLTDLQHPDGNDSLIPIFEGMVERAFSRAPKYSTSTAEEEFKPALPAANVSDWKY
jgi:hypothetical protein